MDGSAEKEEDLIGVPLLLIDVADKTKPASVKVNETGRLPSVDEVIKLLSEIPGELIAAR